MRATRRDHAASVLFVGVNYAPEPTGIGPYTAGMAEGLAERGWDVSVVTSYPHYPWWRVPDEHRDTPPRSRMRGVSVHRLHHYLPSRHNTITRALHEVTFGLRAVLTPWEQADVVVLVSPALLASRLAWIKARLKGVPVVTWVQDIYTLGVKEAGAGRGAGLIARCERQLADGSNRVVVIHDRFRRMFAEQLGVRAPIDVVRNWSHVPDMSDSRSEQTRAAMGWAPDDVVVLHAGNMGAKQGLESVVRASQLAAERGSRVRFVLLGDGNRRAALEQMGANPRLQFIDPLGDDDFHSVLASADMLLVNERPGLTEMSVPSKMTTYFATGLPVIAAVDERSTTYDEMIAADAGPCIRADDAEALLNAAEALALDPEAARTHGRSARAYRERLLTQRAAIDEFTRVLNAARVPVPDWAPVPVTLARA
ncbi:glycosyltransferase [Microbacterium fluvii]|uniref:D-inositol 3-phosphate glycosyltransferase n=1 Tax=Microbacterium fluvii TaxID=415215 RepID=A0ABW2HGD0_9MICO|nr:glycosyltransferase [Microbacterium fluvii]MCU4673944.1 glycosyltransferase [Microbacterium fluvii]